ncbi:MAG: DEAD/DEAH box helicase [Gammaproteobacteria bacterium]|nr:DEAD/DEAH box helicase [Gammaproteobacteria bacterium]
MKIDPSKKQKSVYVGHSVWIPGEVSEFNNHGTFVFWVETQSSDHKPAKKNSAQHPYHLTENDELIDFLKSNLLFTQNLINQLKPELMSFYVTLPGIRDKVLPSAEMAQMLGDFLPEDPNDYNWQEWKVQGLAISRPLLFLKELHYTSPFHPSYFCQASDLKFWGRYSQLFGNIVMRHQFLPAMKCYQPSDKGAGLQVFSGWSLASLQYENALDKFAKSMPIVCRSVYRTKPKKRTLEQLECLSSIELLQHFSEQQLEQLVIDSRVPVTTLNKFTGHWPADALINLGQNDQLDTKGKLNPPELPTLEDWHHWRTWQSRIAGQQSQNLRGENRDSTGFQFGIRLHEPDVGDGQDWRIHFFVSAYDDPSLQINLDEWWGLSKLQQSKWLSRFGSQFEHHLLISMAQAARICPLLWECMETSQPVGMQINLEIAYDFLKNDALLLESAGFRVLLPSWWLSKNRQRARIRINASGKSKKQSSSQSSPGKFTMGSVVEFNFELSIGEQSVSYEEWQELVNAKSSLVKFRGEWMELDSDHMDGILKRWQDQDESETPSVSLQNMLKEISEADKEMTEFVFDEVLSDILGKLEAKETIESLGNPKDLDGELRPYQKQGLSWLSCMNNLGLNSCLADDMGLGKTIQIIALLLHEQEEKESAKSRKLTPTLLIAPTSVLSNWYKEIQRFAPKLKCVIHHGSDRITKTDELKQLRNEHDVLITSFTLIRNDSALFKSQNWHRIVVDEAQNIKNPDSAQTRAICSLKSTHRIALTGTPVENRLMDMWSLFHFLTPGYLGNKTSFRKAYELPIQRERDPAKTKQLQNLVHPFILRRMKTDSNIIDDLPEKVEQKVYCNLTKEQASLYEATVKEVEQQLESVEGIKRKGLMLATLTKLKQICNHPSQFLQDGSAFAQIRSHKLLRLNEMVEEALAESSSMLVFTQFTELGEQLEKFLRNYHHCPVHYLHGGTSRKNREQMIESFQSTNTPVGIFVLSLKAGGVGITLTRANHVFHFDRWWNPAVENQATDRAYRIGQKNSVFVHKMITLGTLEEKIDQMIEDKRALAESIIGSDENWLTEIDNDQFRKLISLNHKTIMEAA